LKKEKLDQENNTSNTNSKLSWIYQKTYLIIACLICVLLTVYIDYRATLSDIKLFSVSFVALFVGLLFESFRISDNWKKVVWIFVGAYLASLISFFPGKREHIYDFEKHIEFWPYFFIVIYALFFGIVYKNRLIAKLTEGITLLLTISLIYWAIDYGFINTHSWFSISLLVIGLLLSVFSIINALTNIHLSRTIRLTLSIWSSVIMFAFAIDNIIRVFSNPNVDSAYLGDGFYISLQYFLLGVSVVYLVQNYMLLAAFLPNKNGNYKKSINENKNEHINRFADTQVNIGQSLFCIIFTTIIYAINYKFQILPRHTIIWLVFVVFPFLLHLLSLFSRQKNES